MTDQHTTAFKEVAIIRHPRIGEYAFGFITSSVVLQVSKIYSADDLLIIQSLSLMCVCVCVCGGKGTLHIMSSIVGGGVFHLNS